MAARSDVTSTPERVRHERGRGRHAASPAEVPARGWKDVLVRTKIEAKVDNIPLLSAGVAFYALLALVPGFSVYTANFGRYNETYGSLGAVIVVMLWLFLTVAVVLLGAELNAELERQTLRDSTKGADRPIGQRGANVADTVGATYDELRSNEREHA